MHHEICKISNIIVIDLEMTCCDNNEFSENDMEVIEIGAVRVCAECYKILEKFQSFVKPVINPYLTDFCKDLLQISQSDVDGSTVFGDVWSSRFLPWLGDDKTFCSWGKGDLTWLQKDCLRHGQKFPFDAHGDLHRAFGCGQKRVLKRNGLCWYEQRHRALNDAITYANMLVAENPTINYRKIRK